MVRRKTIMRRLPLAVAVAASLAIAASSHAQTRAPDRSSATVAGARNVVGTAAACPFLLFIGARGSGDAVTKKQGLGKPGAAMEAALAKWVPAFNYRVEHVDYPAVSVLDTKWRNILNGVGAFGRIGFVGAYHDSVVVGKKWLRQRLVQVVGQCGSRTTIVLSGYSQGAQVVGDVLQGQSSAPLPDNVRKQIAGAALFGDPYFNGDDLLAGQFQDYRLLNNGLIGTRRPYSGWLRGFVFSFCHSHDPVCQHGQLNFKEHTNYESEARQAGDFFGDLVGYGRFNPGRPFEGFRAEIGSRHVECHSSAGKLDCWWLGAAPTGATCREGGLVPTLRMSSEGAVKQTFVCMDEGFHDWLPLELVHAWKSSGFICRRSLNGGKGQILRCLARNGRGFVVNERGALTFVGAMRREGGQGVVAGLQIGPLKLGQSTAADVRAFAGAPDHVRTAPASRAPPSEGVGNYRGTLWGYICPADSRQGWCETYYGFLGGRLTSFETTGSGFRTAKGTTVGSPSTRAARTEAGQAHLSGVQCPGIILPAPAEATFILGANTRRVDVIFLGLKNGSFQFCGT